MTQENSAPNSDVCTTPPLTKALGSSFYWALRVLPKARQKAMFHVYAFCREVDDIADGAGDPADKKARLDAWRTNIVAIFHDPHPPSHLVCLKAVVQQYGLKQQDMLAVIDGMQTDAHDVVRLDDEAVFDLYLDRVASAVGRMSNRVFGLSGASPDALAHHLGRALQITNILRDLDEDAGRNRLYVPLTLLRKNDIETDDPKQVLDHPNIERALQSLAQQALSHYADADKLLDGMDKSKTRSPRVMKAVYQRILSKLMARGLGQTHPRVRLNGFEKLWLAFRHGLM